MTVRVITDSAASLPPEIAAELDITVIDLHVMDSEDKGGKLRTTSGLSSLELAAAYGREMEKAQDDGVIAIHLSKELSSTWSAAVAAAGVFPDTVRVIDSGSAGMVMGAAAMAAATKAAQGAALKNATRRRSTASNARLPGCTYIPWRICAAQAACLPPPPCCPPRF